MYPAGRARPETGPRGVFRESECRSRCQPGVCRDDQSLHTCFQSGMDHWCKPRIVVGRKLVEGAILLRLLIDRRIVAPKEPEHRWGVPLWSKAAEVLARHARLRLLHR